MTATCAQWGHIRHCLMIEVLDVCVFEATTVFGRDVPFRGGDFFFSFEAGRLEPCNAKHKKNQGGNSVCFQSTSQTHIETIIIITNHFH